MSCDVVLRAGNLGDFSVDEVRKLVDQIGQAAPDEEMSIGIAQQRGAGVTPEHVLHVLLPWAEGYAAGKIVDTVIHWARDVWRTRRDRRAGETEPRPIVVDVLGPRGEILRRVKIDAPDGEARAHDGPVAPRGYRVSPARWVKGPRAAGYKPIGSRPTARIYPRRPFELDDLENLRRALNDSDFEASIAPAHEQPPPERQVGGVANETVLAVVVDVPLVEMDALTTVARWLRPTQFRHHGKASLAITIMAPDGTVLQRLLFFASE